MKTKNIKTLLISMFFILTCSILVSSAHNIPKQIMSARVISLGYDGKPTLVNNVNLLATIKNTGNMPLTSSCSIVFSILYPDGQMHRQVERVSCSGLQPGKTQRASYTFRLNSKSEVGRYKWYVGIEQDDKFLDGWDSRYFSISIPSSYRRVKTVSGNFVCAELWAGCTVLGLQAWLQWYPPAWAVDGACITMSTACGIATLFQEYSGCRDTLIDWYVAKDPRYMVAGRPTMVKVRCRR